MSDLDIIMIVLSMASLMCVVCAVLAVRHAHWCVDRLREVEARAGVSVNGAHRLRSVYSDALILQVEEQISDLPNCLDECLCFNLDVMRWMIHAAVSLDGDDYTNVRLCYGYLLPHSARSLFEGRRILSLMFTYAGKEMTIWIDNGNIGASTVGWFNNLGIFNVFRTCWREDLIKILESA